MGELHVNTPGTPIASPTRERILDAAERLFAERGFLETSVRDITAEAGVNLAAINYHFGSKDALYGEVIVRRLRVLRARRLDAIRGALSPGRGRPKLEDLLRAFGEAVLEPMSDWNEGRVVVQLLTREMAEGRMPRGICDAELLHPVEVALLKGLRALEPRLTAKTARMAVHALTAQLFHLVHVARIQGSLQDRTVHGLTFTESLEHVVRFSAAGIRGLASTPTGGTSR